MQQTFLALETVPPELTLKPKYSVNESEMSFRSATSICSFCQHLFFIFTATQWWLSFFCSDID